MIIQEITSPGGIGAWLVETHAVPMMVMQFVFEGGSSQDPVGKEGVASFLARMLDQGAGSLNAIEFQERAKDLSAHVGFNVGKDHIFGSFVALTENRDEALELLKCAVSTPRFDADALELVRARLLVSITRASREPDKLAQQEWEAAAFQNHPYGRPTLGLPRVVSSIAADDLETFRNRVFAKDVLKVVVVGAVTSGEAGKILDDVFGNLPQKADLSPVAGPAPVYCGRQTVIDMDVAQSVVALASLDCPRAIPTTLRRWCSTTFSAEADSARGSWKRSG
jgi:zinc protease